MSKVTHSKLNRKYMPGEDGGVVRRAAVLEPNTQQVGVCPVCTLPVVAAPGQTLRTGAHKACRKKAGIRKGDTAAIAIEKVNNYRRV